MVRENLFEDSTDPDELDQWFEDLLDDIKDGCKPARYKTRKVPA